MLRALACAIVFAGPGPWAQPVWRGASLNGVCRDTRVPMRSCRLARSTSVDSSRERLASVCRQTGTRPAELAAGNTRTLSKAYLLCGANKRHRAVIPRCAPGGPDAMRRRQCMRYRIGQTQGSTRRASATRLAWRERRQGLGRSAGEGEGARGMRLRRRAGFRCDAVFIRDASNRRNPRCSWSRGSCRPETLPLPGRPWDRGAS